MFSRRLKNGYFLIEGLNSFGTVYYFYYFYFYMQKAHGFDNKANLLLAALNGVAYALFSWQGGKLSQRLGYLDALKLGFAVMFISLLAGSQVATATGQVLVMLGTIMGMSLTWPTLEALVSEEEPRAGLQTMVGVYNVVWAATGAMAYFVGGAMLDKLGLRSLFYVPAFICLTQFLLVVYLQREARRSAAGAHPSVNRTQASAADSFEVHPHAEERTRLFLRMAWLGNPFAYIAINTIIAVMPGIAVRLELSTTLAGIFCSVWCFARLGAFILLWKWNAWHYRFRWLVSAFAGLVVSFALILTVPNLPMLILAQCLFGLAIGVLYYSSLFYSMDLSDTKGEHGGIHEAAIGLGNFAGPALGAASLHFFPQYANSSAIAVSLLLLAGLAGMIGIWRSGSAR